MVVWSGKLIARDLVFEAEQSIDVEPGTTTLYDMSRYKENCGMTAITWTQLPSGLWAMVFNGTTSVALGTSTTPHYFSGITVIAWINPTVINDWKQQSVVTKTAVGLTEWKLGLNSTGFVRFDVVGSLGTHVSVSLTACTAGVWQFIVGTYDNVNVYAYRNGVRGLLYGAVDYILPKATYIRVGSDRANTRFFVGQIAMPMVFKYALTYGQIVNIYESTRWMFGV